MLVYVLHANNGTPAIETALCVRCHCMPDNIAYAREQAAQVDDVDPAGVFYPVSQEGMKCCICKKE